MPQMKRMAIPPTAKDRWFPCHKDHEYRCGKPEWPHEEFLIPNREIGKIHKDCPLKPKTKKKSKKKSK